MGVAVSDGLIDIDAPVTKYVPSLVGSAYDGMVAKTTAYQNYNKHGGQMNHESLIAMQAIAKHLSLDSADEVVAAN